MRVYFCSSCLKEEGVAWKLGSCPDEKASSACP